MSVELVCAHHCVYVHARMCCVEQLGAIRAVDTVMIAIKNSYCKSKICYTHRIHYQGDDYTDGST